MKNLPQRLVKVSAQTWLFLFIISAVICVAALRNNNQTMIDLREAVYATDKNNGDVNAALNKLRAYV
jgi:hypothetical protein